MNITVLNITSMLVLIIARPKCTLTASHAAPGIVRQTDRRQNVTLRYYAFRYGICRVTYLLFPDL